MPVDPRLLEILCCPVSKVPLARLGRGQLRCLNEAIARGDVRNVAGGPVSAALTEGLITTDAQVIYRVDDDIAVLRAEVGSGTPQLSDFPAA